jgi:hypothetical protein
MPVDQVAAHAVVVGDIVRLADPQAHRIERVQVAESRVVLEIRPIGLAVDDSVREDAANRAHRGVEVVAVQLEQPRHEVPRVVECFGRQLRIRFEYPGEYAPFIDLSARAAFSTHTNIDWKIPAGGGYLCGNRQGGSIRHLSLEAPAEMDARARQRVCSTVTTRLPSTAMSSTAEQRS